MPLTIEVTPAMMDRATKEWTRLAGMLPIRVENVGGTLFAYGDELAIRRLADKMNRKPKYSKNLNTWYYNNDDRPWKEAE